MGPDIDSLHTLGAYAAVLLGIAGPVLALVYAVRVERRGFWRRPMMVAGTLAFAAILAAYLSGQRLVDSRPELLRDPSVGPHLEYADRLLLPGIAYFALTLLTGLLNPRTGALRTMLPLLLSGFSLVVLALIVLSGDAGARLLLDRIITKFQ